MDKTVGSRPQSLATHLRSFASDALALLRHILFGDVGGGRMRSCWRRGGVRCIDLKQLPRSSLVTAASCPTKRTLKVVQCCKAKSDNDEGYAQAMIRTSFLLLPQSSIADDTLDLRFHALQGVLATPGGNLLTKA